MAQSELRISKKSREYYTIRERLFSSEETIQSLYQQAQRIAQKINAQRPESTSRVKPSEMYAIGVIRLIQREVIEEFSAQQEIDLTDKALKQLEQQGIDLDQLKAVLDHYFPATVTHSRKEAYRIAVQEMLLLEISQHNPAVMSSLSELFDSSEVKERAQYQKGLHVLLSLAATTRGPSPDGEDIFTFLNKPAKMAPGDLSAQLSYIMNNWRPFVKKYSNALLRALDFIQEDNRPSFPPGPGPLETADYSTMSGEYEAFSQDSDWMPNVVMIAKSTLVWLDQLSKVYGQRIERLDQIPNQELNRLAEQGFTALWLIGLWERSTASKKIKNACGNPEAEASAYSLHAYDISEELGGWGALDNLRSRCRMRGIRLASDMVPNHTGIDSQWMIERPDLYLQTDTSPFPSYSYEGENLSGRSDVGIYLEDHYYNQTDAAVTFKRVDFSTGKTSYVYHGNDGTGMPWNDTAQLDYLNPDTRETVINTIVGVAKNFSIIRFDAAMTLAKKHIQRLWYPLPGTGGDIPSRSSFGMSQREFDRALPNEFWREVVDRIAQEAPDTLLLAEAFWMMEGYFVRTLGMHRVYNSAFMNMLKHEENRKYRDTIKNTISFDPEILKRYVNFMNNPDEDTAIAQFGQGDKYLGVCTLLVTMPGLPMFGHGQVEGFHEKYGMEFKKAYWDEQADQALVSEHYRSIFPLMKKRYLFSNAENFALYDVVNGAEVIEQVFAYTNKAGSERALVMYNNSYGHAAGWITESAPMLKRLENGERSLVTLHIGEALGLTPSQHHFYTCQGYHDGLTYLRSSQETCERGFFTMLRGYERQIFLDFQEIEDTDGVYALLFEQLNGTGTPDLGRAIRRLRYAEIHHAAAPFYHEETVSLMDALTTDGSREAARTLQERLSPAMSSLIEEWNSTKFAEDSPLPSSIEVSAGNLLQPAITKLLEIAERTSEDAYLRNSLQIMPETPVVLLVWLMMLPAAASFSQTDQVPEFTAELLLAEHIREPLRELTVPSEEAERIAKAVTILHRYHGWFSQMKAEGLSPIDMLARLLNDPCVQSFARFNWYEGVQWYHKESLQETFFWFYMAELLAAPDAAQELSELIATWLKKELFAEFRVDRLLSDQ
ncbi:MAG: alpha-amylase family glycosyl hydrolase [Spirochaetota bacterium]